MALKWAKRLVVAGLVLEIGYFAVRYTEPAWGASGSNEQVKEAVTAPRLDKPLELARMEVTSINPARMVERLRVSGELRPINRVVLRARDSGKVQDISAREGQAVRTGDVLVRFETNELQSALEQRESDHDVAHAELLLAMQTLTRIVQLVQKNVAAEDRLDKAKSEIASTTARLRGLSAQVDMARTALHDAQVFAPFDGVVSKRSVDQGARVSADAELFTIVDTTTLEAKVLVSTRDVPRVSTGQTAELQIDGFGKQSFSGRVVRISPVADDGTRLVPVYIRLSNPSRQLVGGMFATGSILLRQNEDRIVIPAASLRKGETGAYVLKLEKGYLVRQPVTVGSKWDEGESLEISDGLAAGDMIVTVPLPELQPHTPVTISEAG
ncbi:efflux RND transporter periplasmic adaptor subunit [Rhizobium sp. PL01]|uniref:efflux RND transporter periplasmic adaptor subunit n=1 Tax=Rhizobium sp. PL01 TaxID=3085631 RepID=UPI00298267A3|nr:efflux RND transporter periplasmic adaptor subunit [Rhizobium sp. PL01]MDW5316134.1 efflux RND transporter periplasmic adaptor subunit [Rhizobium sp. PL01]